MIILFAIIVCGITVFVQSKSFIETNKQIKKELENKKYEKLFYNKFYLVLTLVMIFGGFLSIVFGIYLMDDTTIALGVLLLIFGCGELIKFKVNYLFYYNDTNFILSGKCIRYKSIKKIFPKRVTFFNIIQLETLNGTTLNLYKPCLKIIQGKSNVKISA